MFKSTPQKEHTHEWSFTTASKRTQILSLNERRQSVQSDKRSRSNQANKIGYKNKMKILKLQFIEISDQLAQQVTLQIEQMSQNQAGQQISTQNQNDVQQREYQQNYEDNTVSFELKISKEALYQSVHYLDKLANLEQIVKSEYQFYGLTCLCLSHKTDNRVPISYTTASHLVQGSRDVKQFKETEVKIIKQLDFKLNPFTVWQQVNMLVCGFQKYFKKQLLVLAEWSEYRNRIVWICQGLIMQKRHSQKEQQFLALSIVFLVGCKLAEQGCIQQKKLLSFCLKLIDHRHLQLLQQSTNSIRHWIDYTCPCQIAYSPQVHHPQLKIYAKQR